MSDNYHLPFVVRMLVGVCFLLTVAMAKAAPVFDQILFEPVVSPAVQDDELNAALHLINDSRFGEAEAAVRKILEQRPYAAPAHEILGTALALQGNLPDAVLALERAVELSPEQVSALTKLGDIAMTLGQPAMAETYFRQAVERSPGERKAHQRLGLLAEQAGDTEQAIMHYQAGIRDTAADYLGVKLNLAQLYVLSGNHSGAVRLLEPFAEASPLSVPVLRTLAVAHIRLGNPDQALEYAGRLATLSESPQDHFLLGSLREQAGQMAEAEQVYRYLLTLDERFWPALNNLAALLLTRGETGQALEYAHQAYELAGKQVLQPAHTYGMALLRQGNYTEAVTVLEQARSLSETHALTRYHLGVAYQETGAGSAAREELKTALELDARFEHAEDARRRLGQL